MKYITVNSFEVYLFSPHLDHGDFARTVADGKRVTGAGFVTPELKCVGESTSLGIGPGPLDDTLVKIAFKTGGGAR